MLSSNNLSNREKKIIMEPVDIFSSVEIGIPLYLFISYAAIISICLLFSRVQLGLAVSFLFVFYIGYFYNRAFLLETVEGSTIGVMIYMGLGLIVITLAIVSFFSSSK